MIKNNGGTGPPTGLARSLEAAAVLAKVNACGAGRWQATKWRHGRLTIVAPSPIAAQELTLRSLEVLNSLNDAFDRPVIRQLFIQS